MDPRLKNATLCMKNTLNVGILVVVTIIDIGGGPGNSFSDNRSSFKSALQLKLKNYPWSTKTATSTTKGTNNGTRYKAKKQHWLRCLIAVRCVRVSKMLFVTRVYQLI